MYLLEYLADYIIPVNSASNIPLSLGLFTSLSMLGRVDITELGEAWFSYNR